MYLEDVLRLPFFELPAINPTTEPFIIFAEDIISRYINYIKTSRDLFDKCPPKFVDYKEYCDIVESFGQSLIGVIRSYKKDGPAMAYEEFKKAMDKAKTFILGNPASIFSTNMHETYYRCKNDITIKTLDWFFHTPFESDAYVTSTRFSINGCPALYLTNCLIVGYKETRTAVFDNFQAVKFRKIIPMDFLNLDYNFPENSLKTTDKDKFDEQLQLKGLMYPLLFITLCEKNDAGGNAAPQEYIIPQFLAQWVKETKSFDGIKYPSTKVKGNNFKIKFFNLFIPPLEVLDKGYCPHLKRVFLMSNVCSASAHGVDIENFFGSNYTKGLINEDIETIEWDTFVKTYEETSIGRMEFFLNKNMTFEVIPF